MPLPALALLGIGQGLETLGGLFGARSANRARNAALGEVRKSPGAQERALMQMLGFAPNVRGAPSTFVGGGMLDPSRQVRTTLEGTGFNLGNDALMQVIRGGGNPFDASQAYANMLPALQDQETQQLNQLHAGFNTLGARLGSGAAAKEGQLRGQLTNQRESLLANLGLQSHEAAQGRLLGALGEQSNRTQLLGGLNQAALSTFLQALQGSAGLAQNRQAQRLQAYGVGGAPQSLAGAGLTGAGQGLGDISQLMILMNALGGAGGRPATGRATTPFTPTNPSNVWRF